LYFFSYPLEWICKVYLEYVTDTLDFTSTDLDERALQYVDRLLEKSPNSTLGKLSKGAIKWKESDFAGARDILKPVVGGNENPNFYGSYVLCFCHDQLKEFSECEAQVGITSNILEVKVKEEYTRRAMAIRLKALLVKTLYLQSSEAKMTKALRTMEAKPKLEGDEHTLLLAKIWAATGKTEEAERAMTSLKSELVSETEFRLVSAMLAKSRGDLQSAISLADKCLEMEQDNFEALVLRGRIEFEKEAISDTQTETTALPYFLKAAKLNSDNPVPFLFLGHLYRDRGDVAKARKCYQKSFQLDPGSMEAGCSLSDIFRSQVRVSLVLIWLFQPKYQQIIS
jgi:superkiller protein 3